MSTDELLTELLEVAHEQLRWQRATSMPDVRRTIETALTTTRLRRAYEMCDGSHQGIEIAAAVGVSKASISNWTRSWRDLGIAYEGEDRRVRHLVSLETLGLAIEVDDNSQT